MHPVGPGTWGIACGIGVEPAAGNGAWGRWTGPSAGIEARSLESDRKSVPEPQRVHSYLGYKTRLVLGKGLGRRYAMRNVLPGRLVLSARADSSNSHRSPSRRAQRGRETLRWPTQPRRAAPGGPLALLLASRRELAATIGGTFTNSACRALPSTNPIPPSIKLGPAPPNQSPPARHRPASVADASMAHRSPTVTGSRPPIPDRIHPSSCSSTNQPRPLPPISNRLAAGAVVVVRTLLLLR